MVERKQGQKGWVKEAWSKIRQHISMAEKDDGSKPSPPSKWPRPRLSEGVDGAVGIRAAGMRSQGAIKTLALRLVLLTRVLALLALPLVDLLARLLP